MGHKVLVIPDTHLKPRMFGLADKIMAEHRVDYAVQLGDNFDDFYCYEPEYKVHFERMERFAREHPETIWLYGNHEVSYVIHCPVTGNTVWGHKYVFYYHQGVFEPKFVHGDGKVIFSHAGIFKGFLEGMDFASVDDLVETLNNPLVMSFGSYWRDDSPIWARPQYDALERLEVLDGFLQVVGHTPMREIVEKDGVVSVDVFSTNWGKKFGEEKMIIVDTEKPSYEVVNIDYRKTFGEVR